MRIECGPCVLRSWRTGDEASIVRHGNNRSIWINVRDRFPHPYTLDAATSFVLKAASEPTTRLAIEVDGEAAGSISLEPKSDIERVSAEIGYWLGESLHGRGIMTAAVRAMALHGLQNLGLTRVFALPFARNTSSIRVLEKAGFKREGTLRRSVIKDGVIEDQILYALTDLDR